MEKNNQNEVNVCEKVAREFYATKKPTEFYEVMANDDACGEAVYEHHFNDDQLKALHALEEKYGPMVWVKHLDEVFTDVDELHDLTCGDEVLGMNLDLPHYKYRFARQELRGNQLKAVDAYVELEDEEYIRLLTLCLQDRYLNMNSLKYADRELYEKIVKWVDVRNVDDFGQYSALYPYMITMDEVMEDVAQIRAAHPELKPETFGYHFHRYWNRVG